MSSRSTAPTRDIQTIYDELSRVNQNIDNLAKGGVVNSALAKQRQTLENELEDARAVAEPKRQVTQRDLERAAQLPVPKSVSTDINARSVLPNEASAPADAAMPTSVTVPKDLQRNYQPSSTALTPSTASLGSTPGDPNFVGPTEPAVRLPDLTTLYDTMNQPPTQGLDPEQALAEKILSYMDNLGINHANPAPLSFGESVALGLLGGLDPHAMENLVLPILARERDLPRQAALDKERMTAMQIQALETVANMYGKRADRRSAEAYREAQLALAQANMKQDESQFERGQAGMDRRLDKQIGAQRSLLDYKTPPPIEKDWYNLVDVERMAVDALNALEEHPTAGGVIAGVPGSQQVSRGVADVRTAIDNLASGLRREKFGTAQTATEMGTARGFIPFGADTVMKKRTNIRRILDIARAKRIQIEKLHGSVRGMGNVQTGYSGSGLLSSDIPLEFEIPDSELGGQ